MKHASRGLVLNGYSNLKMFNFLFWIIIIAFFLIAYGMFPFPNLVKQDFSESTHGQFCMMLKPQWEDRTVQMNIITFMLIFVQIYFSLRFLMNIKKYLKRQNLNMRTFSQFGGTARRNLYTLGQTYIYFSVSVLWYFFENLFIEILQYFDNQLDRKTSFIIYNALWIFIIDFFFGLFVPIKHIITSYRNLPVLWNRIEVPHEKRFFTNVQRFEPRRDVELKEISSSSVEIRRIRSRVEGNENVLTAKDEERKIPQRRESLVTIEC